MTNRPFETGEVKGHFDALAPDYDRIKWKNRYYYRSLNKFIAQAIPPGKKVLEIGTATGELLNFVKPAAGTGIDLSPRMIEQARAKFPHLEFEASSFETFQPKAQYDYILAADVIEHVPAPENLFKNLRRLSGPSTQVVLTMANPLWEPFLEFFEKLRLKMVEGPHLRISLKEVARLANSEGFQMRSLDRYLLFPVGVPFLSAALNDGIGRLPFLKPYCLIVRFVFSQG